ncbi:hypothetical protein FISHEDRAFT_78406 [Fistulina hepatica ATCC 64428]|nr:hypothetical protein FISHEDRAFT_78406 [Fistulina hepatica ATCC 64428]
MKFSASSLLLLAAAPLCLAAKPSPHQRLVDLAAAGNGVIQLDENTYDLLTSPNRNWSAAIVYTALDKRMKCAPCKEFDPEWSAVVKAWSQVPAEDRDTHFFGTLDFTNGQAVFQKLGMSSAPAMYVYPATQGPRKPESGKTDPFKYDFSSGIDAQALAEQLSRHTPVRIPYKAPFNWSGWFSVVGFGLTGLLALRFISPVVQNRWFWALIVIGASIIFTSGYMFTQIRGAPWNGGPGNWISGGYNNQFGQEVQVVGSIYGLLSFAFTMLTIVIPYQSSPFRQRLQVYLWAAVVMIVFSVLVSIFRLKNGGYPFRLLM